MRKLAPEPTCNHYPLTKMITQDAFTKGQSLIGAILAKMVDINKWHKDFFVEVLMLFLTVKDKINFMQMERYSSSPEIRFRNMFKKSFDFGRFNSHLITDQCSDEILIGFDPSFLSKSGKHTPNVGYFYSGVAGAAKRGMEVGCTAIIDVKQNTAYHYEAIQTPVINKKESETGLVEHYCQVLVGQLETLKKHSTILVVDAWFNKKKFVDSMLLQGLEMICRLRHDANLNYIYNGPRHQGKGRPKKYICKVNTSKIDKRIIKKTYEDDDKIIYEGVVYSISLKINIKLAYTEYIDGRGNVVNTILYFSTNTQRSGIDVVRYYKARFQMEFIFRDSKQFTGLENCQARSEEKIYNHVNYAMTAVNVAKGIIRQQTPKDKPLSCSIQDIKTELFNQFFLDRIFINYAIDPELKNNIKLRQKILDFGKIAA
jgi:hypothetical protein